MAIAIIGGLLSSTILTLVVVPVFYAIFERLKRRRGIVLVEQVAAVEPADVEVKPTGT